MNQSKIFLITTYAKHGYNILVLKQFEQMSYFIAKNFDTPVINSVEASDFYKFQGIDITDRIEIWCSENMAQIKDHNVAIQKLESYLNMKEVHDINVKFSSKMEWILYF